MIRKFVLTASAVALAAGALGFATAGAASAKPNAAPITAGAGSSLSCSNLTAAVKVSPSLEDDWVKADHSSDPDPKVVAIPNTSYAPPPPEKISGKAASASCSGSTAKQGALTSNISKIAVTLASEAAHPTTTDGSCIGLADSALGIGAPSTAEYLVTIKYTAAAGQLKVNPTTITDATIPSGTGNFTISGGTVTGSFAGSTNLQIAAGANSATIGLFSQELAGTTATSTSPAAPNVCQAGLKIKGPGTGPKDSATLVKPKGLKAIGLDPASSTVTGTR
jgi:hypothetical protein